MKNKNLLSLAVLLMFAVAALGGVLDDFEDPDYLLGAIKGQQGWDGDSFSGGPEGSAHYFGFFGLICAAMRRRHAKCAARDWVRPGLPGPSSRVLTADLGG